MKGYILLAVGMLVHADFAEGQDQSVDDLPFCAGANKYFATGVECKCGYTPDYGGTGVVACPAGNMCDIDDACDTNSGNTCAKAKAKGNTNGSTCFNVWIDGDPDTPFSEGEDWHEKCCLPNPGLCDPKFYDTCLANGMIPNSHLTSTDENLCTTETCTGVMPAGTYFSEEGDFGQCCLGAIDGGANMKDLYDCKATNCPSEPLECVHTHCATELEAYLWVFDAFPTLKDAFGDAPPITPSSSSASSGDYCEETIQKVAMAEPCFTESAAAVLGAQGTGDCPTNEDLCSCAFSVMNGVHAETQQAGQDHCDVEVYAPSILDEILAATAANNVCEYSVSEILAACGDEETSPASTTSFVLGSVMSIAIALLA